MRSSTSNSSPLLEDIRSQRPQFGRFCIKCVVFIAIVLCTDRLIDAFLRRGLDRFYGLSAPAEVLCIGHSHMVLGVDAELLSRELKLPVAKYATNGVNTFDRLAMIEQCLDTPQSNVRVIVYDVDARTFTTEWLSSNSYTMLYPYMDHPSVDRYVEKNAPSEMKYRTRKLLKSARYSIETVDMSMRGWLSLRGNLKRGGLNVQRVERQIAAGFWKPIEVDDANMERLRDTIRYVRSRGVALVFAYIPTVDLLNNIDRAKHESIIAWFRRCADETDGVYFLNYSDTYESRHELFYDPVHLNNVGREVVTRDLARDVAHILQRRSEQAPPPDRAGRSVPDGSTGR